MTGEEPGPLDETVDTEEAAGLLEVPEDRIEILVEEGLLTPVGDTEELRFRRAEVLAVRELGG
jgi:hypothetical protein